MKISQREAQRLRRRVQHLEDQERQRNNAWIGDYPGGVDLGSIQLADAMYYSIYTARKLGHSVVVTSIEPNRVRVFAVKR